MLRRASRLALPALCAALLAGPASALAGPDPAPAAAASGTPPGAAPGVCGFEVSPAVYSAWQELGGQDGRLGCATARESASSPSPTGAAARVAVFGQNGEIVLHASGPRAGQAYAVSGCFYRLYVQFGGTGGWLGLPVSDTRTTPDGSRQTFEGGFMRSARALDSCEAVRNEETEAAPAQPAAAQAAALIPLDLYENAASGDRESLAAGVSRDQASAAGYARIRPQARVMADQAPGTARLKLFEDDKGGRHQTLAADQSEQEALAAGFAFAAGQGWVWTDPHPGAVRLELFRDPATGRSWLTAGPDDEREARDKGLSFVRVEGYAPAP